MKKQNEASALPKLIVVLGQTATGKSDLAVTIAKQFNGEVISADSRQVYRGLDLLSGKITKKEMRGIPHHMLDVASLRTTFSVSLFQKKATSIIKTIHNKNKIPLVVGGTGMYIDALIHQTLLPEVPPNKALRKKLETKTLKQLSAILTKLDPIRMKTIDIHNKVRLIRGIEIAKALGKVPPIVNKKIYDVLFIGLKLSDEELQQNIHSRILKRLTKGMLREAKQLHESGISWKRLQTLGLEPNFATLYIQKKLTKKAFIENLKTATWQYAKRQKTWFKRNKDVRWFNPNEKQAIEKVIKSFLQ